MSLRLPALDSGLWTLDSGLWTLDSSRLSKHNDQIRRNGDLVLVQEVIEHSLEAQVGRFHVGPVPTDLGSECDIWARLAVHAQRDFDIVSSVNIDCDRYAEDAGVLLITKPLGTYTDRSVIL